MKRTFRNLSALFLTLTMLLTLSLPTFAADSSITYHGKGKVTEVAPGSDYTSTDLFDSFKDVMPGDKLTESITIKNKASSCDYIKLYMKAEVHDEKGNPLTYSEAFENTDGKDQANIDGQRDETVATMQDFLSQLTMRIYNGNQLIYNASPDEAGALVNNVLLGKLKKNESANLKVELDVPIEMGNEYANRVGEVDWVFLFEEHNNPSTPDEPEEPEVYPYIPGTTPTKTGDSSNIVLWAALLLLAGGTVVYISVKRKRN